ncbi:MAG: addiction module antidote protein [Rhodanobacteraceae bacterium]
MAAKGLSNDTARQQRSLFCGHRRVCSGQFGWRSWSIRVAPLVESYGVGGHLLGFLHFEEAGDDPAFIVKPLGDVARAKGMMQIARETGLAREALYRSLSASGNPSFATVVKVARALGVRLAAVPM